MGTPTKWALRYYIDSLEREEHRLRDELRREEKHQKLIEEVVAKHNRRLSELAEERQDILGTAQFLGINLYEDRE